VCKKSFTNSQPFVKKMKKCQVPWGGFFWLTLYIRNWICCGDVLVLTYRALRVCRTKVDEETGTVDATVTPWSHRWRHLTWLMSQRHRYMTVDQVVQALLDHALTTLGTAVPLIPASYTAYVMYMSCSIVVPYVCIKCKTHQNTRISPKLKS